MHGARVNDTGAIRERLNTFGIKANFYVVGMAAKLFPEEVKVFF